MTEKEINLNANDWKDKVKIKYYELGKQTCLKDELEFLSNCIINTNSIRKRLKCRIKQIEQKLRNEKD